MRKKNVLWTMDKQGHLYFPLRERQLKNRFAPDSVYEHGAAAFIVMLLAASLDFAVFSQLFSQLLHDRIALQWLTVVGFMVVFDLAPIYLGNLYKKHSQGQRVSPLLYILLITGFLLVFAGNFWLRVTVKDLLIVSNTTAGSGLFGNMGESSASPAALAYAIVSSYLPAATSMVSFVVAYLSCDPLKKKLQRLAAEQVELEQAIEQIEAVLAEYELDRRFAERLDAEDQQMLSELVVRAQELGIWNAHYVREKLKEHLGTPASTNELSKPCRKQLMAQLEAPVNERLIREAADEIKMPKVPQLTIQKEAA